MAVTPVLVGAVLCRVAHGSAGAGDDDPLFMLSWNDFFFASILTRSNAITAPIAVNFMNLPAGSGDGQQPVAPW